MRRRLGVVLAVLVGAALGGALGAAVLFSTNAVALCIGQLLCVVLGTLLWLRER